MIRRDLHLSDGPLWLLISQVDHAHVSGELTRNWNESFPDDVVDATAHHDDGWSAWEAEPKLNPDLGAPFSFLEMPIPAALVIWDHSIAAVATFGPLASFLVAGHFYNLLNSSDRATDQLAVAWLSAKRKLRTTWLDTWIRSNPSNNLNEAKRAQQMLLLSDLFSLWLCCDCPASSDGSSILRQSDMKLQADVLFEQFAFEVTDFQTRQSEANRLEALEWSVAVSPYPFVKAPLLLESPAIVAPAKKYLNWAELRAASWPINISWQLHPGA